MAQVESLFWGIIAALGALIVELILFIGFSALSDQTTGLSFAQLFLVPQFIVAGALVEEIFKYIIISRRVEMLSLNRAYLTNSMLVGLGFFSVELGLISITGVLPEINILVEIALIHVGTAGIIGYLVATKNPRKLSTLIQALFFAGFFHSAYNLLILNRTFLVNYVIFALLGWLILLNLVNLVRINKEA